jgi:Partial alpha/beta-hydrolase lipase region
MEEQEVSDMPFVSDGSHSHRGHQNQVREASGSCFADVLDRVGACHPAFFASLRQPCFEYDPEEGVVLPIQPKPEGHSSLTSWSYRIVSGALSTFFLVFFVLAGALIKAIPSGLWILWSRATFRNPDRYRPFFEQEQERKGLKTGILKADIPYYAGLVGLGCEEIEVETEDGYILTMQRLVDGRPEGINSRRIFTFTEVAANR